MCECFPTLAIYKYDSGPFLVNRQPSYSDPRNLDSLSNGQAILRWSAELSREYPACQDCNCRESVVATNDHSRSSLRKCSSIEMPIGMYLYATALVSSGS